MCGGASNLCPSLTASSAQGDGLTLGRVEGLGVARGPGSVLDLPGRLRKTNFGAGHAACRDQGPRRWLCASGGRGLLCGGPPTWRTLHLLPDTRSSPQGLA